ncbi:MAG: fasciclin domain-containing protein [Methylacidiphilales bacterium]|nr:fasciclin domain-containing protein [Candidatus Methylacidiphilales bacterium]
MKSRFRIRFTAPLWLVPALLLGLFAAPVCGKPPKIRDIADTVAANPILTNFAAMVQAADLGTFLSSRGPFTVFVPTDSAFSKLPPGMLDTLLRPENKVRLQDIVLFHVVNGKKLTSKDLFLLKTALSCQGAPLTIKTTRTGVQLVMKAKIVHADIHCRNGVIDEIDTVLMPPEASLPPLAAAPVQATNVTPMTNAPSADTNSAPAITNAAPETTNAAPVAPVSP